MHYIRVERDMKLAVDETGSGKNTVFFIHGWPLGRRIFEYQLNILPEHNFRCVTLDLRGFGDSDVPFDGYDYDTLAFDVYRVIEAMGLDNVTLVGFSMGGAIAVRYMSMFGEGRVNSLALLAAAAPCFTQRPGYPYGMKAEQVNALIQQAYVDRPNMNVNFGKLLFASNPSDALRDWFKDISFKAGGISTIKTAVSLRDEDLREDIGRIHVPVGIFHGKLDKICPYEFALLQKQAIPQAQLFTFEKSGHAVFYDEMDKFNADFVHFLRQK